MSPGRNGTIIRHAEINIGLAVAIDDGLVVPVLHRADTLNLAEIAARREDLVTRAQAGKLRPADIQGGGFTISNLGMYRRGRLQRHRQSAPGRHPRRRAVSPTASLPSMASPPSSPPWC